MRRRHARTDQIILVIAHRSDIVSQRFSDRYRRWGVRLLTPDQLSVSGWSYCVRDIQRSRAMVAGSVVRSDAIHGVLSRLSHVSEDDLPHIVPADRGYVAAEMGAFLLSWLTALPCPVVNRPTPACLSGEWRRREQWVQTAFRLGIPVAPLKRRVHLSRPCRTIEEGSTSVSVTLIGQKVFGCEDAGLVEKSRALARAAQLDCLTVRFSECGARGLFLDVDPCPDIDRDDIGMAMLNYIDYRQRRLHV